MRPHFQAQLVLNQQAVWQSEAGADDYPLLLSRLLTQLDDEVNGACGVICDSASGQVVFRCRKVATE